MFYLLQLVFFAIVLGLLALLLFAVVRWAVRAALDDHYKTVKWYERTGEWHSAKARRSFGS